MNWIELKNKKQKIILRDICKRDEKKIYENTATILLTNEKYKTYDLSCSDETKNK